MNDKKIKEFVEDIGTDNLYIIIEAFSKVVEGLEELIKTYEDLEKGIIFKEEYLEKVYEDSFKRTEKVANGDLDLIERE